MQGEFVNEPASRAECSAWSRRNFTACSSCKHLGKHLQRRISSSLQTSLVFLGCPSFEICWIKGRQEQWHVGCEIYHRAAEVRRDQEGGEPWYQVLFYGF